MSASDYVLEALAVHLRGACPNVAHVAAGWERQMEPIEYPTVIIDDGPGERVTNWPRLISEDVDPGDPTQATYTVSVATLEIPITLSVVSSSKAKLRVVTDEIASALLKSASNPLDGGLLQLPLVGYGDPNACAQFRRVGTFGSSDYAAAVGRNEFRATLGLEGETEELHTFIGTRITNLDVDLFVAVAASDFSGTPEGNPYL